MDALYLDFAPLDKDVEIIGITANNGEQQTEIEIYAAKKRIVEEEILYDMMIPDDAASKLREADEIVISLNKDVEISGYGISINGVSLNAPVVFELGEYLDYIVL